MTPQNPKPSMHEVSNEMWVRNAYDKQNGFNIGLGATINIINGGYECRRPTQTDKAQTRLTYFKNIMQQVLQVKENADYFMTQNTGCANMNTFGSMGSAGKRNLYWHPT